MRVIRIFSEILLGLLISFSPASAQSNKKVENKAQKTGVPRYEVTETEIKFPGVTISRLTSEVRIEAVACLESGILEYVVCQPNTFEHEAIFTTIAKPELVHAALLLIGVEPNPQSHGLAELWFEKALKQTPSLVKIEVEWQAKGKAKRLPLASLLRKREKVEPADGEKKSLKVDDAWVFAGSFIHQNPETGEREYAGNRSGILVGIWPNPSTVIQYGISEGNPYEGKNLGMEIREDRVPSKGTRVKLIFSRFAKAGKAVKENPTSETKESK